MHTVFLTQYMYSWVCERICVRLYVWLSLRDNVCVWEFISMVEFERQSVCEYIMIEFERQSAWMCVVKFEGQYLFVKKKKP